MITTILLAVIVLALLLLCVEALIEDHEDRTARRPWHSAREDEDTVAMPVPSFLIGDPR